jgi:hypothetical protein
VGERGEQERYRGWEERRVGWREMGRERGERGQRGKKERDMDRKKEG